MRFPYLSKLNKNTEVIATFGGINQQASPSNNEYSNMKNISFREYPAITQREKRGTKTNYTDPKGFFIKNGTFVIDGLKAYYNGTEKFTVNSTLPKKIVGMGAYIIVFPDKVRLNTSTGVVDYLESTYTQSSTITIAAKSSGSAYAKINATGIGNSFKLYDAVYITGCSDDRFNGVTKIIYEISTDYIVVTEAMGTSTITQASGMEFKRKVPDLDYVIERDNRLWGCSSSNHEVYSCKLGDATNWNSFEGLSDDAYAATVASDGDFTGISKYSSYIVFFKEHTAHVLRGDKPANYSITEKKMTGVKSGCDKSLCVINDSLYYVGYDGVYAFNGGTPQKISSNIEDDISNAQCGEYKNRLYVSAGKLYVFDTVNKLWSIEDNEVMNTPQSANGNLYYIDDNKNLTTVSGNRDEIVDWELESVILRESSMDNKYVSKFKIMVELAVGSDVIVYARFDKGEWEQKGFVKSTMHRSYTISITPRRCSTWQYKLVGRGDIKLLAVSRDVEGGSDINGYVQSQFR